MLPEVDEYVEDLLEDDIDIEESSKTYKLHIEQNRIQGMTDEQEAMQQAIYKILNTEKGESLLYSEEYGIELQDLYGKDVVYVAPELEHRIKEALLYDERIEDVDEFYFSYSQGKVYTSYTVNTVFGNWEERMEVEI